MSADEERRELARRVGAFEADAAREFVRWISKSDVGRTQAWRRMSEIFQAEVPLRFEEGVPVVTRAVGSWQWEKWQWERVDRLNDQVVVSFALVGLFLEEFKVDTLVSDSSHGGRRRGPRRSLLVEPRHPRQTCSACHKGPEWWTQLFGVGRRTAVLVVHPPLLLRDVDYGLAWLDYARRTYGADVEVRPAEGWTFGGRVLSHARSALVIVTVPGGADAIRREV